MFEQDYFMRMIMQVSHFIARIIRLKQEQRPEHALVLLGQGYQHFFGLSIDMVERMSARELQEYLLEKGKSSDEAIRSLFEFLDVHMELLSDLNVAERDEEEFEVVLYEWRLKKVELFLLNVVDAHRHLLHDLGPVLQPEIERLLEYQLPAALYDRLFAYYEQSGQFEHADDVLHIWEAETPENDSEQLYALNGIGCAFYQRLLKLSDEQLETGSLPREEVVNSLENWRVKFSAPT